MSEASKEAVARASWKGATISQRLLPCRGEGDRAMRANDPRVSHKDESRVKIERLERMAEVAEGSLLFLQVEMVNLMLENHSTTQDKLQSAEQKVENIGFDVGSRIAQKLVKDRPRLEATLDIIKFVCKDFWYQVYRKQIDKLQTNNRGVYMLQDNRHRILARCSASPEQEASAKQLASIHAKYSSGLIRGALQILGVVASVAVEVPEHAACHFTVRIQQT